ncbi:MAG TPA: PaaI family thioesterase [Acidimicrobiales bacterium]|nr:PaaI family thioesterase [Acidimicrobiales bacterium]
MADPDPQAGAARIEDAVPMAKTLGIRTVSASKDQMVLALDWRPEITQPAGLMHGGAIMTLADTAGGSLSYANLPEGATGTSTIESKINFLAAVKSGTVTATARVLKAGRSVIVVETELADDNGQLVAKVVQTQIVLRQQSG